MCGIESSLVNYVKLPLSVVEGSPSLRLAASIHQGNCAKCGNAGILNVEQLCYRCVSPEKDGVLVQLCPECNSVIPKRCAMCTTLTMEMTYSGMCISCYDTKWVAARTASYELKVCKTCGASRVLSSQGQCFSCYMNENYSVCPNCGYYAYKGECSCSS